MNITSSFALRLKDTVLDLKQQRYLNINVSQKCNVFPLFKTKKDILRFEQKIFYFNVCPNWIVHNTSTDQLTDVNHNWCPPRGYTRLHLSSSLSLRMIMRESFVVEYCQFPLHNAPFVTSIVNEANQNFFIVECIACCLHFNGEEFEIPINTIIIILLLLGLRVSVHMKGVVSVM